MSEQTPVKLPMSYHLLVNEKQQEVFMSFALLNQLAYLLGDVQNTPMVHLNPEMREAFLRELLSERSKTGKITTEVKIDEVSLNHDEVLGLLDWAAEHVLDFTIGAIEKSKALQLRNQARMLALQSSPNGQAS